MMRWQTPSGGVVDKLLAPSQSRLVDHACVHRLCTPHASPPLSEDGTRVLVAPSHPPGYADYNDFNAQPRLFRVSTPVARQTRWGMPLITRSIEYIRRHQPPHRQQRNHPSVQFAQTRPTQCDKQRQVFPKTCCSVNNCSLSSHNQIDNNEF